MTASRSEPAYPAHWCRQASTRDGVPYRIRPIRVDDAERERAFIDGLSPQSRHSRFMYTLREPSPALVDHFVHVDYETSMAFVAVVDTPRGECFIAVVRYAGDARRESCEFAITVGDAWQARGVGSTLTATLFAYARAQGFRRVFGTILGSNRRMLRLAHALGMQTTQVPGSGSTVEAWLDLH